MTNPVTGLVSGSLATYRLTKLVIDDEILREPREVILSKLYASKHPLAPKAAYLLQCPWCVSIWAGGGLVLLLKLKPELGELLVKVLAASAIAGLLHERV